MVHIVYVGSNSVDWNTKLDESELKELDAEVKKDQEGKKFVNFTADRIVQFGSPTPDIFFRFVADQNYKFDKNPKPDYKWETMDQLNSSQKVDKVFKEYLKRPGGGATNNLHVAATLSRSMVSDITLDLLVLQESEFTKKIFDNELNGANYTYNSISAFQKEMNNISFSCDDKKITFTSKEDPFNQQDKSGLEKIIGQKIREKRDMLVVNSVKDKEYLDTILEWYDKRYRKPIVVAAVTNSMLSQRRKGLKVRDLVSISDIYVSNIEELYDFLKKFYKHRKKGHWQDLNDNDLYEGMRYILKLQQKNGKKGKVYVTCGDNGAVVMDSNGVLFYQGICFIKRSPTQKSPDIDLNGAGDTFAGVMTLLEGLGGYSALEILGYANAASQLCITGRGANEKDRITVDSINNFNKARRQEILKYDECSEKFCPYSILTCNLP